LTQLVADIGYITDADPFAPQSPRHLDAEQALRLDCLERLRGESCRTVDRDRVIGRNSGYDLGSTGEIFRGGGTGSSAGLRNLLSFHQKSLGLVFLVGGR
jgi:hypothetical protein